ncbi:MAG: SpoIIE family protein phosphatase [Leptospiraceae bacterium]|nr:SpoIIE family protein phosphatase [Leptospiraceae bacterium]MBK9502330.1 SpoIIE family protein phosphatase [Leptospiraceae bacterium]MBP9162299.1 SpoIIE family protein phosphatase [Leptospiraceae bacterium]
MSLSKILYVDDEKENLVSFKYLFKKNFEILLAISAEEGLEILQREPIQIIITDQKMRHTTGVEFLKKIANVYPDPIKILLTGYADVGTIIEAINHGEIYRYIPKPFQPEEMLVTLKNALEVYTLRMQNKELLTTLIEKNQQLSIFNEDLERKVQERTEILTRTLGEINELKFQQDGDYYLTSLLIEPLSRNSVSSEKVTVEFFLKQKKEFNFRGSTDTIGGDINIAHNVKLMNKSYIVFINGDAMGKSTQGAGGAIVLGTAFEVVMERLRSFKWGKNLMPDEWLYNTYQELNQTFLTFEGLMMVSMVLGILEEDTGNLYFINAEHPYPVLYREGKASFINTDQNYNKLGFPVVGQQKANLSISNFQLLKGDIVFFGSDGRDDVIIETLPNGQPKINEDQNRFLTCVENGAGNIERIVQWIQQDAILMDDLSILKITYTR